jgi:ubiquinone/menaquinone biosynthesis C-methylase UbiE
MKKPENRFHKRTDEELMDFIKKLELQALETAEERLPLYLKVGMKDARLILDVGCGSGFVTRDIARLTKGTVIAIDGSISLLTFAHKILKEYTNVAFCMGDAQQLTLDVGRQPANGRQRNDPGCQTKRKDPCIP